MREEGMASGQRPPVVSDARPAAIGLEWLIRLRWAAVGGQLATVVAARALLGAELPLGRLLVLIAILAASNAALRALAASSRSPRALCGAALTLDTLLLTGLLHATGGPYNPFSILYLVYIALAAVVLRARWTWFLAALSIACYGLLFVSHIPLEHLDHAAPEMRLHLQGMWLAFAVAGTLTAYFVVVLANAIERRDAAIAEMRERAARRERVVAVATLAAGAAHELGTPLATIAVAAKELERSIRRLPAGAGDGLIEDATLIRAELDRCRAILNRLAADSGQGPGEAPEELRIQELVSAIVDALPAQQRERLTLALPPTNGSMRLPRVAVARIVHNLLSNAFDATGGTVSLSVAAAERGLKIEIHDDGPGIPADVLPRVGDPFFSTKGPGRGLGLGVFIARTLSEQMGGGLRIDSRAGSGTTAVVEIGGREHAAERHVE